MSSTASFMKAKRFSKFVTWDDKEIGESVGGVILAPAQMQQQTDVNNNQPRFFPEDDNGERQPMMQMLIEIDTMDPDPAIAADDGKRTLTIRGGFKYESSRKALADELARNELDDVRVGDYIRLTRIPNVKAAGTKGRTHQFECLYVMAENFGTELDAETHVLITSGEASDEAQATPAPVKATRGRPKKVVAPAAKAAKAAESAWEDED